MGDGADYPLKKTTCPYCGVGCGVEIAQVGRGLETRGDAAHPANFGRLCGKGLALSDTIGLEDRLLYPELNGSRVDWDTALLFVANGFREAIENYGPDSVAFYVSGQLLTEDYYVANKLMKGFLGSANIDTNSRLCMASSVVGHKRAFGGDIVPGCYEDLEEADLLVLTGSNLAWCHPVLYRRMVAAKDKRPAQRCIVIDPRRTPTAEEADLHLPIKPSTDVALWSGLLKFLWENSYVDHAFVREHTEGADAALEMAAQWDLCTTANATGLSERLVYEFYSEFARTERTVSIYSQGVNQARDGADRVNAIINCHLTTGRLGKPGAGPFSVTGQPNAMGGREVGGLANQLACHMGFDNPDDIDRVKRFWHAPNIAQAPGLTAVDLFDAVHSGQIKAIWIMATNPVDSMPNADKVARALEKCPLVVVSDVTRSTDTAAYASALLPALAWGEKDGMVTNSERRISRQRAFLPPPGEARPDWRMICDVAQKMGWSADFDYEQPVDIFREYAELSGHENDGARAFDISGLEKLTAAEYERFEPLQWPYARDKESRKRLFADGRFFTPSRRGQFICTPQSSPSTADPKYPYVLNSGRIRDHWHTLTRTGRSARLSQHLAEPFIELHPEEARLHGIGDADIVSVETPLGQVIVRALITDRQQKGSVFAPMHWTNQFASNARIGGLVKQDVDPVSHQPALKSSRCRVTRFPAVWYGFAVSALPMKTQNTEYWALARTEGGHRLEIASALAQEGGLNLIETVFGSVEPNLKSLILEDSRASGFRYAAFSDDRLVHALYVSAEPVAVSRAWICEQLTRSEIPTEAQAAILAGRPGDDGSDSGSVVCSCHNVGIRAIETAIREGGCESVDSVGAATFAGTNCGSCRPEISRLIARMRAHEPL